MTLVTLYSKPNCPQCVSTKNTLKALGVEFTEIDIMQDDMAFMHVTQELGYRSMPVVVTGTESWSGHNAAKITAIPVSE